MENTQSDKDAFSHQAGSLRRRRRRGRPTTHAESAHTGDAGAHKDAEASTSARTYYRRRTGPRRRKITGPIATTGPGGFNKDGRLDDEQDRVVRRSMFEQQALDIADFMKRRDVVKYNKSKLARGKIERDLIRDGGMWYLNTNFREVLVIGHNKLEVPEISGKVEQPAYDIKVIVSQLNKITDSPEVTVSSKGLFLPHNLSYDGFRTRVHIEKDGTINIRQYEPSKTRAGAIKNSVTPNIIVFQVPFQGLIYEVWQYDETCYPNVPGLLRVPESVKHRLLKEFALLCDVANGSKQGLQKMAADRVCQTCDLQLFQL